MSLGVFLRRPGGAGFSRCWMGFQVVGQVERLREAVLVRQGRFRRRRAWL